MCTTLPPVLVTRDGDREARADLRRPRGLPPAPAALVDRRADEPVHLALDRRRPTGDGPQEFHLVLLDNGRTRVLRDEVGRQALHCIRCCACLNVCPVYARTGGHAYGSVYPGPIGAILTPQLVGRRERAVAAVRVDPLRRLLRGLPGQDRHPHGAPAPARGRSFGRSAPRGERAAMRASAWLFGSRRRLALAQRLGRLVQRPFVRARRDRRACPARSPAGRGRAT